jgi:hypothetical protein
MINILLFDLITNNLYHYYHEILLWILGLQRDQPGEGRVSGEGEAPGTMRKTRCRSWDIASNGEE